ncbi:MAG: hypothetical protein PHC64_07875 [Candidatus Gastranaerophilales bacterium]|nr:hypothetical protein [Candidatus Gastranaerophilales bacterium]
MSGLYKDFEKRFSSQWFSANWAEIEVKPQERKSYRKDLETLQTELNEIKENIEFISQKQLRLSNLAKFYEI